MKNIKNILLLTILLMFGFSTIAQETEGASFGLRGGINFQNINGEDDEGDKLENDLALRFHGGVMAQIPVAPEFYFQPGLLYTTKGAKFARELFGEEVELNTSYLELPLNLLYKPLLGTGHLLLGFGPYVAYGLSGKLESGGIEEDIEFGDGAEDDLKRLDYGANLFFGYELANGFSAQLNTQLGLANILPDSEGDATFKNTGFGISLGYNF